MYNEKFIKDLEFGNKGEKVIFTHLSSIIPNLKLVEECDNGDYDLKVEYNGVTKTYEVKTEDNFCKPGNNTGNLFIETECSGKLSGINRSIADWYVFYLPHYKQIWYIKKNDLKTLIETNDFKVSKHSGDGGRVVGYLVPRNKVRQHFKIYHL